MPITLKAARINKGLNQTKAAELIGVSKTTLSAWENYRYYPSVIHLPAIEAAYDVKYDDIIFLPSNYALSVKRKAKKLNRK